MNEPGGDPATVISVELARLRDAVTGVRGSILTGVDGLLVLQEGSTGSDPSDLAALAAAAYGIGHRSGDVLHQGRHHESTIHSRGGYFTVYSVDDSTLLAVIGEAGLNVARLHLEAKACIERLAETLRTGRDELFAPQSRL